MQLMETLLRSISHLTQPLDPRELYRCDVITEISKCKHLVLLQKIVVVLCFVFGNNWIASEASVPEAIFKSM